MLVSTCVLTLIGFPHLVPSPGFAALVLTIYSQCSKDLLAAIVLLPLPAHLTLSTHVPDGLHASSIPYLPTLHIGTQLHYHACALMTCTAGIEE